MDFRSVIRLNNGVDIPLEALGVFKVDNDTCVNTVRWALEAGYRHIDTAAIYGNESGVGRGIRESGVPRGDIFLTTKLWNEDMRRGNVRGAFEESLDKLGTDYVDLYLIHWPVPNVFEKCWAEMEKLYREGRIRAIGVSNFHKQHMDALLKTAEIIPAVNQIELHPLLTQKPLMTYCRNLGIQIESYRPLGGTGEHNLVGHPTIAAVAERYGKTGAQILLRWNLQCGNIILPKSVHRERIIQNTQIYDFEISAADMELLDGLNRDFHTGSNPDTFDF